VQNSGVVDNMAELTISTVTNAIKEIAGTIEHLSNASDVDLVKLRLDYVNGMLVTLDVPDEIVNTMSSVHQQLERFVLDSNHGSDAQYYGYQASSTPSIGRGRPTIDISREQLAFLVDQGFTAGEMSGVLGVGKRTVQRRLAAFGISICGEFDTSIVR
jgi:hypothetical protein